MRTKNKQKDLLQVQKLSQDVMDLHETFQELNELVHERQPALDEIEANTESIMENTHAAKNEILKASKYQNNSRYLWGGAALGGLVGGPVGACVGLKAAAALGVAG